ncbi:serine/threonine-protein kinase CTR1 [Tanacetum coccineum]
MEGSQDSFVQRANGDLVENSTRQNYELHVDLFMGNPCEIPRNDVSYSVKYYGEVVMGPDGQKEWVPVPALKEHIATVTFNMSWKSSEGRPTPLSYKALKKDVVSSVATVLSDLCSPGEWMPMEKLHAESVADWWRHSNDHLPELLRGEPTDEKSDVYSFGVITPDYATSMELVWGCSMVGVMAFQNRKPTISANSFPILASLLESFWAECGVNDGGLTT